MKQLIHKLALKVGIKLAPETDWLTGLKLVLKVVKLRMPSLIPKFKIARREKVGLRGEFLIRQIRDGEVIAQRRFANLIVNAGKAEVAALLGAIAGGAAFTYLAVGTGTVAPAATDTALGAEITTGGLARVASTNTQVTTTAANDTLQMVGEWTASASHAVTEAGAFNDASAGDMLCRQTFAVINLVSADKLETTYKVQAS